MKNLTLASTIVVITATFAAPSFAMENVAGDSRAKIESVLEKQKNQDSDFRSPSTTRATTFSSGPYKPLDKYEAVIDRLFDNQTAPAGR